MIVKAAVIWIAGLLTLVPYATWYLLFEAPRDQYALLIVSILFWVFGYWGLAGIVISAIKIRRVAGAIERARSSDDLRRALLSPDGRDAAVDLIASDNHIPRFLAVRVYDLLLRHLAQAPRQPDA